jgi:hypothetical protein
MGISSQALLLFFLATPLLQAFGEEHPCKADARQFCAEAPKTKGAMVTCLKNNLEVLDPGCRGVLAQRDQRLQDIAGNCVGDAQKICSAKAKGKQSTAACLMKNRRKLSAPCRKALVGQ